MRQLKNVTVTHVSYVDKAANKRSFLLTKADGKPNFTKQVKPLIKADDPQKLVYGVVYEPDVEDSQGDSMGAAEIEKAAHGFMENYQQIDKQHDFTTHAGQVVESYIAPADMEIGTQTVTKGTWVLVTKATDEIWDAIQKGDYTGYSLAGQAEVLEKSSEPDTETKSFIKALKSFFTNKREADEMEAKEMQELITKALEPVNSKLEELEKAGKEIEPAKPEENKEVEVITKAVQAAVQPLNDRLEKLEKARNSNKANDVNVTKSQEDSQDVPSYVEAAFPLD